MENNKQTPSNQPENLADNLLLRLSKSILGRDGSEQSAAAEDTFAPNENGPKVANVKTEDLAVSREELEALIRKHRDSEAASRQGIDMEKNINEAEKYIDAIITGETEKIKDPDAAIPTVETSAFESPEGVTENISVYEPESVRLENGKVTPVEMKAAEPAHITDETDVPTDTAMLKAFGLNPKGEVTGESARVFDSLKFSNTDDMQSTEEISNHELEGEDASAVSVKESGQSSFEYTSFSQNKSILTAFKKKYTFSKLKMVGAGIIAVLLFVLENFLASSALFEGHGDIFVGIDWILVFAAAALVAERIYHAALRIANFEFVPDSITLVALFLSAVTTAVTALSAPAYTTPRMYGFGFALCVFLSTVASFISLRRDVYSFKLISSTKVKKILARVGEADGRLPEIGEFVDYIAPDSDIAAIQKTDFVSDFFDRKKELPASMFALKIIVPACFGLSVLVFFLAKFAVGLTGAESLGAANSAFLMGTPFAAFIAYSYPSFLASFRAYAYNSAIVSDSAAEDYLNTSVVAFRDTDAFPAGKLKLSCIKLYADRNIANALYYASGVFSKIGGPLANVFKGATLNSVIPSNVEILEIASEGICAMVDGKNIVVGRPSYMENQCFETSPDEGDEAYEGRTKKRILYLACEQVIIAKFYIQYNTTSDFLYNLHHLTELGICTSIRTADPCIDEDILYDNKMSPDKFPVKIVKGMPVEEKAETISAHAGGVVSVGTTKEMIKTLLLFEKLRNVSKITLILKGVAAILGFATMMLLLFTGKAPTMISLFPALYQCFWLIPTYIVSKIYI